MSISNIIISTSEDVYKLIEKGNKLTTKFSYSHPKKTNGKNINLQLGRIWINILLPEDYPLINEALNSKKLNTLIIEIFNKYGPKESSEIITKLQTEAFKLATISPNTFNIENFIPPKEWIKKKEEFLKRSSLLSIPEFKSEVEKLTKELIKYNEDSNFRLQNIMNSEATKVDSLLWGNLLVSKGYVMDIEGNVLGPIKNGFNDGLDKLEYYHSAVEARKNFYIRSALTGVPGYLTTKMIKACAGIQIDQKNIDCGTTKTFDLLITEDNVDSILQRNYLNQLNNIKLVENKEQVLNKKIKLRSPLYCKSEKGICPTCYGNLYKKLNTINIGIIAGGAINSIGITTMMKMRHKTSSVITKEVDFVEMTKQSGTDINIYKEILIIDKNTITAKKQCSIIINTSDYNDTTLVDCGDKFQIIGILNIQYGDTPETINFVTLPYPIMVNCFKPIDIVFDGELIIMNYESGELIIKQEYYDDNFNERTLDRLFEGGAKYINNPERLVMTIYDKMKSINLVYIETVVSNMFRDKQDVSIPARLTDYKQFEIIGMKKLPHKISWLSGLIFENINRSIKIGLLENKDSSMNPLEKITMEQYSKL